MKHLQGEVVRLNILQRVCSITMWPTSFFDRHLLFDVGNIPPMVRLLQAYIKKAPGMVTEEHKLVMYTMFINTI